MTVVQRIHVVGWAASGKTHTTYQGRSQALATSSASMDQPAAAIQSAPRQAARTASATAAINPASAT